MAEGIKKQIGTLPAIKTKLHLFEIGRKMLGADSVPRPHNAALEERKSGFYSVGVNVSHDVYTGTMVNLFVVSTIRFPHRCLVRNMVICENDLHVLGNILADVTCERSAFSVLSVEEAEIAVALADAYNDFLIVVLSDVALTAHLAADVSNVHFNFPIQHRLIGLRHCVPNAMAEIPSRFVSADTERALNLTGGHSLLRFAEEIGSGKPSLKGQMRVIEHGSSCDRELVAA